MHANAHGHTVADANWAKDNCFCMVAGLLSSSENSYIFFALFDMFLLNLLGRDFRCCFNLFNVCIVKSV